VNTSVLTAALLFISLWRKERFNNPLLFNSVHILLDGTLWLLKIDCELIYISRPEKVTSLSAVLLLSQHRLHHLSLFPPTYYRKVLYNCSVLSACTAFLKLDNEVKTYLEVAMVTPVLL
jgi:hypothetical protein